MLRLCIIIIIILFQNHNNTRINMRPRNSRDYPAPRKSVEEPASRAAAGCRLGPETGTIHCPQRRNWTGSSRTEAARGTIIVGVLVVEVEVMVVIIVEVEVGVVIIVGVGVSCHILSD